MIQVDHHNSTARLSREVQSVTYNLLLSLLTPEIVVNMLHTLQSKITNLGKGLTDLKNSLL